VEFFLLRGFYVDNSRYTQCNQQQGFVVVAVEEQA